MLQSPVWIFSENQLFSPIPFAKKEQFAQCCLPWAGSSSQKSGPGLFPAEIQATPSQSSWPKLSFLAPLTSLQWHCKFPNETDFFPPKHPHPVPKAGAIGSAFTSSAEVPGSKRGQRRAVIPPVSHLLGKHSTFPQERQRGREQSTRPQPRRGCSRLWG